jgi:hypothetical protein
VVENAANHLPKNGMPHLMLGSLFWRMLKFGQSKLYLQGL